MAAIFIPTEQLRIPEHLRSRTVPAARPAHLRLVGTPAGATAGIGVDEMAGTATGRSAWMFRLLLAAVAVAGVVGLNALLGSAEAPVVPASPAVAEPLAAEPVAVPVHVVQPGETLWSIAAQVAPGEDLRPVVDELARRAGGVSLQPGQRIAIDGLGR